MMPMLEVKNLEVDIDCAAAVAMRDDICILALGNLNSPNQYVRKWPGTEFSRKEMIDTSHANFLKILEDSSNPRM